MINVAGGSTTNTASMTGILGCPELGNFAHGATEGGVIALTKQLAVEGAVHGIRANSISPGLVATPQTDPLKAHSLYQSLLDKHMSKRAGTPDDIAYCALYLASDVEAGWVTGANFVIDGGMTCPIEIFLLN